MTAASSAAAAPVRLGWRLPRGPAPAWVAECMALLDAGGDVACRRLDPVQRSGAAPGLPGLAGLQRLPMRARRAHRQGPAAPRLRRLGPTATPIDAPQADVDIVVGLDAAQHPLAREQPVPTHWLLGDADGAALAAAHPMLEAIAAGRGLALALWQLPASAAGTRRQVRRIHVRARARYGAAIGQLPRVAARLLRQACVDWRLGVAPGATMALATGATTAMTKATAPAAVAPSMARVAAAANLLRHLCAGAWRDVCARQRDLWLQERWRLGVIDAPVERLLAPGAPPRVRWFEQPDGRGYWADPVGAETDAGAPEARALYCEYFDEHSGVGRIERLELGAGGAVGTRRTLPVGDGHVSFPQVIEIDGRRLGLVENCARRECVLHEIDARGHWQPVATLLSDVAAVDPTLFFWEGRHWLALTDRDLGDSDTLSLHHAERLEGPWTPHANNPVKADVTGSRMAGGFFQHEGALYRPAQNCLSTYGAAVVLMRIVRCTPSEFEEVPVAQLRPDAGGPCPDGIHTVSAWGGLTLIDGKRLAFNVSAIWRKLCRRLGVALTGLRRW